MSAPLTEEEFSKHVNTKFRVALQPPVEFELTQVKGYAAGTEEQGGMERFSVYFAGPGEPLLPQGIYSLEHEGMGAFELFLVPLKKDQAGIQYEAVFNYFKQT